MKNNGKNGKERKNGKCSFSFHLMISEKKNATRISVFLNNFRFFRCYSSFGAKCFFELFDGSLWVVCLV